MAYDATRSSRWRRAATVGVGLLICYLPLYVHRLMEWTGLRLGPDGPPSILIWNWRAVGLLLVYILRVEGRRLASILLITPTRRDIELVFWFWGVVMAVSWLIAAIAPPEPNLGTETILSYPLPLIVGIIFTAATTEEVLFRGYVIERIAELTSSRLVGVGVSLGIFLLPHIAFFGPEWLLYHGIGTAMIYVLYVWRRNLCIAPVRAALRAEG